VDATEIAITATGSASGLTLSVRNTDDGVSSLGTATPIGTGLSRLRERLAVLYGDAAQLICGAADDGTYEALLIVPRNRRSQA
jgi:signal transduction histidine kinase